MKYEATKEDMQAYSAIVQQIAYLDYQRNELFKKLAAWETAHQIEGDEPQTEAEQPQ